MLTWIAYHQQIHWYHGTILIIYYLAYVSSVVFSNYGLSQTGPFAEMEQKAAAEELATESSALLGTKGRSIKPPRLSIPDHGFAVQPSYTEHHLGNVIRPVSPNSLSRPSLRIDTMNMPATSSTQGSFSARPTRHPMTPRVGIRTSLFGAIEYIFLNLSKFQEQITAIRRASSTNIIDPAIRRRQISMPQQIWNQSSQTPIPDVDHTRRRMRASTVGDHLIVTSATPRPSTSSDSSNNSTGVAEDYFTYLSACTTKRRT
ncbi:hypothetical protein DFQ29_005938 [Apophysomyces sp. BC1021]|nr:hypothetical protein DFQ29_005938 [Apophysomyces sp. BC1021]